MIWKHALVLTAIQVNSFCFIHKRTCQNSYLLLAPLGPDRDEDNDRLLNLDRQLSQLSKAFGTDQRTKYMKPQPYNADNINKMMDLIKSNANQKDTFTLDSLEPSTDDAFIPRNKQQLDMTKALLNSAPDIPREYFKTSNISGYEGDHLSIQYLENQREHWKDYIGKSSDLLFKSDLSFKSVFENESGFLNQSKAFHMYLASNNSLDNPTQVVHNALWSRRGEDYRLRQRQALEKLQLEMMDVENRSISRAQISTLASNRTMNLEICSSCGCRLSRDEIIGAKKVNKKQICRECYVDRIEFKNGSPYLSGRLEPTPYTTYESGSDPQVSSDFTRAQQWRELFTTSQTQNQPYADLPKEEVRILEDPKDVSPRLNESPVLRTQSKLDPVKKIENEWEYYQKRAEETENEVQTLKDYLQDLEGQIPNDALFSPGNDDDDDNNNNDDDDNHEVNEEDYWVTMVDPDTGESFRWNKYTGEMDW